jgi:hypothetical protein
LLQVSPAGHGLVALQAAVQRPTTQMSPPVQSESTLHDVLGTVPLGLPPGVVPPEATPPGFPGVFPVPPRLGLDGLSRVQAPAAAIKRLAAIAPSRLLKIGRDIVSSGGFTPSVGARGFKAHAAVQPPGIRDWHRRP